MQTYTNLDGHDDLLVPDNSNLSGYERYQQLRAAFNEYMKNPDYVSGYVDLNYEFATGDAPNVWDDNKQNVSQTFTPTHGCYAPEFNDNRVEPNFAPTHCCTGCGCGNHRFEVSEEFDLSKLHTMVPNPFDEDESESVVNLAGS